MFADERKLAALAGQMETPAYLFSEKLFADRAGLVKEAFGPEVDICFSIKANPFLLSFLPDTFAKVEVCSPGELRICQRIGIAPEKIIFSGVNKRREDIEAAVEYGCAVLTAESPQHLNGIERCAGEHGKTVCVLLRLTGGSQFGMDESVLKEILRNRSGYPHVDFVGIHYFTGTQKRKAKKIIAELDEFEAFLTSLREECGYEPAHVEYGTGLAVDYFDEDPAKAEQERLLEVAPRIRSLGAAPGRHLTVEMGRFFAAPCGFYLNSVADVKQNCGVNYAVLDGGLHQMKYDGQLSGMQIPGLTHLRRDENGAFQVICAPDAEEEEKAAGKVTLCGSLCTTMDVLARGAYLPGLREGDILVFHETGAYSVSEGMAAFLSRDLPAVWLLYADGRLVKVRENTETYLWNCPQ